MKFKFENLLTVLCIITFIGGISFAAFGSPPPQPSSEQSWVTLSKGGVQNWFFNKSTIRERHGLVLVQIKALQNPMPIGHMEDIVEMNSELVIDCVNARYFTGASEFISLHGKVERREAEPYPRWYPIDTQMLIKLAKQVC